MRKALSLSNSQMRLKTEIPTYFLTIQVELSKLVENLLGINAGTITLNDIVSINKQTRKGELQNFLMVMEVYGHSPDPSAIFEQQEAKQTTDDLKLLRIKSLDQLT